MSIAVESIYNKKPIRSEGGIPIFSQTTNYVENYEKISMDHISEMETSGKNPFIDENLWNQVENSTVDLVLKYAQKGKILDVGVGLGRLLTKVNKNHDFEMYGCDISLSYLKLAKSKNIDVCLALVEDMPYQENTFDVIVCTDVLEHVLDFNLCLNNILNCLKPDGFLVLRVPFRENLRSYVGFNKYEFVHLRNFDEHLLMIQMDKIFNCDVLEYSTVGTSIGIERFKYTKVNIPFLMKILRFIYSNNIMKRQIEKMFHNVEINVVVRKRKFSNIS